MSQLQHLKGFPDEMEDDAAFIRAVVVICFACLWGVAGSRRRERMHRHTWPFPAMVHSAVRLGATIDANSYPGWTGMASWLAWGQPRRMSLSLSILSASARP